jgi:DNA-binding transcriptional MerR regulator
VTSGLNIAALARRTGVAPDTLRKWEQRYGILRPERTTGGQRRYTERDVARVEWLRARLAEGYRIGEASLLLGAGEAPAARTPQEHVGAILDAVERIELSEVGQRIDQAFALLPLETVLPEVVETVLHEVGARWESGTFSVAQEHVASASLRARLGHLLGDAGGGVRGTAVLACAPEERHELGLMTLAIALRNDGWQIAYVGADTPLDDGFELAGRLSATFLGISITMPELVPELEGALKAAGRPQGCELVLGGAAASPAIASRLHARHVEGGLKDAVGTLRTLAH